LSRHKQEIEGKKRAAGQLLTRISTKRNLRNELVGTKLGEEVEK
jgi:hypothetical protein